MFKKIGMLAAALVLLRIDSFAMGTAVAGWPIDSTSTAMTSSIAMPLPIIDVTLWCSMDDNNLFDLRPSWSIVSAPGGGGTFSAAGAWTTLFSYAIAGTYTLRCTVTNGVSTSTADITLTVVSAASQAAFYVDPYYGGANGASDGSQAKPWTSMFFSNNGSNATWNAINNALDPAQGNNNVIVYFAARKDNVAGDVPAIHTREIDLWRGTFGGTNRLTFDGMSLYNTNSTNPSSMTWVAANGADKHNIQPVSDSLSIGVQGQQLAPTSVRSMQYTTIRGFDVSKNARILIVGDHMTLEYVDVHDITGSGANIQIQPPVTDFCTPGVDCTGGRTPCTAMFNNRVDMTEHHDTVTRGYGEAVYISGTYFRSQDGGCVNWGQTHRFVFVTKMNLDQSTSLNGEPDCFDLKAGLRDLRIIDNVCHIGTFAGIRGMVVTGIFPNASPDFTFTDRTNNYFEGNIFHDGTGKCIEVQNQNYTTIRNNVCQNNGAGKPGIDSTQGFATWPYSTVENLDIFNNDISNPGSSAIDLSFLTHNARVMNNLVTNYTNGDAQFSMATGTTITNSDYNIEVAGKSNSGLWAEGMHSTTKANGTTFYTNEAGGNFTLSLGSFAIGFGTGLQASFLYDRANAARTNGSPWDAGAYSFASSTHVGPTRLRRR